MQLATSAWARRFLHGFDTSTVTTGWASAALDLSLRHAVLAGVVCYQPLMAVALLVEAPAGPLLAVRIGCCAAVAGLSWAALRDRAPHWLVPPAVFFSAFTMVALATSQDGAVVFTANWLQLTASALPAFLVSGWGAFVVQFVGCVGYSAGVAVVHPEWGPTIPQGQLIAGFSILLFLRAGLAFLGAFTAAIDTQANASAQAREHLARQRRMAQDASESARVLHDTVINTLSALAAGGGAIRDRALVRDRCARDIRTVEELLAGHTPGAPVQALLSALRHAGLDVQRSGLRDTQLQEALAMHHPDVAHALAWAAQELVQNAAKHAQIEQVVVHISRVGSQLRLTIADRGIGFDPDSTAFRGLKTSVLDRADLVGIEFELSSARGHGTSAVLTTPPADSIPGSAIAPASDDLHHLEQVVSSVRRGTVWLWSVGVLLVGIVLELTSQPGRLTPTYLAIATGATAVALAWTTRRRSPGTRRWVSMTLVALAAAGFACSAATSRFGQVEPVLWQVVVTTGILLLLTLAFEDRRLGILGCAVHLATAVVIAAAVQSDSRTAALVVLIGALLGVGLTAGWARFDKILGEIGVRVAADHQALQQDRFRIRLQEAATEARTRWRAAGLQPSLELLESVRSGSVDPGEAAVLARAGKEEAYLRQVIQLDPAMVHMGPWFVRALGIARARDVGLALRTGSREPDESAEAATLGRFLISAVELLPAGEQLAATLFAGSSCLTLTVVAAHPHLSGVATDLFTSPQVGVARSTVGDQDLVELRVPITDQQTSHVSLP